MKMLGYDDLNGRFVMIRLTEAAQEHILAAMKSDGGDAFALSLVQKGCSGYSYDMKVVRASDYPGYASFESGPVMVLVPGDDCKFLAGTELDYVREGFSSRLVVSNPNVDNACGCGASVHFKPIKV